MKLKLITILLLITSILPARGFSSPNRDITITIIFTLGRGSDCEGRGLCKIKGSVGVSKLIREGFTPGILKNTDGRLSLVLTETSLTAESRKNQFGDGKFIMEEPLTLSADICKALGLPEGYTIKKGEYAFKKLKLKEIVILFDEPSSSSTVAQKEEVIIDEPNDITWDEKSLLDILGYESPRLSKGSYTIRKDWLHPFGVVKLNVTGNGRTKKEMISKPFPGPWSFNSGIIKCNLPGFSCCRRDLSGSDKVIINPIYTNGILSQLEIEFLTEEITNGKAFSGTDNQPTEKPQTISLEEWSKNSMVMAVNLSKPYFKKGYSLKDFIANAETNDKHDMLVLTDIYKYLNSGASNNSIYNDYSGKSIIDWWKIKGTGPYNPITNQALIKPKKCGLWCKIGLSLTAIGDLITNIDCIWRSENNPCPL